MSWPGSQDKRCPAAAYRCACLPLRGFCCPPRLPNPKPCLIPCSRWFAFRDSSSEFRQRIRYQFNGFLSLNHKTITPGTIFLSAYGEIFLNPSGPVFERNRVYGGAGYQLDAHFILQVGYVNQANYNYTAAQGQFVLQNTAAKNNVVVGLTYSCCTAMP